MIRDCKARVSALLQPEQIRLRVATILKKNNYIHQQFLSEQGDFLAKIMLVSIPKKNTNGISRIF